ncbi:hypothetical protein GOP47_0001014 [Adiantum capillus-veneris]|uniref:Uncharacterized protein n=1 Tax=Adiantum capillus-veneris TaxID=13818 RepID=A0A9D4VF11_ADICA|nr:hypothetical protein GOP47_0001014 [Adiantum capillus-veneris]
MHVDKVVKEQQTADKETFFADQGVGKPSLLPCYGKAMLTGEECFNGAEWGFDDPVVDVDDESQVWVAKAMARIQGMQGFLPLPMPFEESTGEDMPLSALDDQLPQVALHKDNDVVESSLAVGGETCDAKAFQDVHACVGRGGGSCMQFFEGLCYQDL